LKSFNKIFIEIGLATIIVFVFINQAFNYVSNDFDQFALGEYTSAFFASKNDYPIHIEKLNSVGLDKVRLGWEKRGNNPVLFVLGNSQTSAINQQKSQEVNYVKLLSDSISKDIDLLSHSMPNANLQEMFYSYHYFINNYPVKYLMLPVFMDDLREDNIRDLFFGHLIKTNYNINDNSLIAERINKQINIYNSELHKIDSTSKNKNMKALDETVQEKVEIYFDNQLNSISRNWSSRNEMRGRFFIFLYQLRNTIFAINPQSKRNLIPKIYDYNISALKSILMHSQKNNIKVLLYIPPIRNDVEIPYNLKEYENFKIIIDQLSKQYSNTHFINLESVVPGNLWGMKDSTNLSGKDELDFMHFSYEGHKILFYKLINEFHKIID
jgi:hypothetical protein